MSKTTIPKGGITADAIDATLIADDAISEEHIDATVITASTALTSAPADTDEFLISDAGTIKRIDASLVGGGGLTLLSSLSGTGVTDANASVDSIFTSSFDVYRIVGFIAPSQDTEARIKLRASGSDISDGNYNYVNMSSAVPDSGSTITDQLHSSHGADFWEFASADINFDSSGDAVAFDFTLHDPLTNILSRCYMTGHSVFRNGGSAKLYSELFGGGRESNPNADGIKFFTSGGTMNYYRINIFGVKNS